MTSGSFTASNAAYEATLATAFGDALATADLAEKHARMRENAFLFLRGTCFRWAECFLELAPELTGMSPVGSVGDAHVGNFGLWRDARARLVWGANDFDEAAVLPWPLDLVRLAASALLSRDSLTGTDACDPVLDGYIEGLADPVPSVLERRRLWLRDAFLAGDDRRERFWAGLEASPEADPRPAELRKCLLGALGDAEDVRISARSAGVGSLGRPRFAAIGRWRGGPVAAEAKGRLPGCFAGAPPELAGRLAAGPARAPDPTLGYAVDAVVRRLAPDARKLDLDEADARLTDKLLRAMGAELAAVHMGLGDPSAVGNELANLPAGWLASAAGRVADWTRGEWRAWRNGA